MEKDYKLPVSLFTVLTELFLTCECGHEPHFRIYFDKETSEVVYDVWCPHCGRVVTDYSPDERFDLDFAGLAEDWNSRISED